MLIQPKRRNKLDVEYERLLGEHLLKLELVMRKRLDGHKDDAADMAEIDAHLPGLICSLLRFWREPIKRKPKCHFSQS